MQLLLFELVLSFSWGGGAILAHLSVVKKVSGNVPKKLYSLVPYSGLEH